MADVTLKRMSSENRQSQRGNLLRMTAGINNETTDKETCHSRHRSVSGENLESTIPKSTESLAMYDQSYQNPSSAKLPATSRADIGERLKPEITSIKSISSTENFDFAMPIVTTRKESVHYYLNESFARLSNPSDPLGSHLIDSSNSFNMDDRSSKHITRSKADSWHPNSSYTRNMSNIQRSSDHLAFYPSPGVDLADRRDSNDGYAVRRAFISHSAMSLLEVDQQTPTDSPIITNRSEAMTSFERFSSKERRMGSSKFDLTSNWWPRRLSGSLQGGDSSPSIFFSRTPKFQSSDQQLDNYSISVTESTSEIKSASNSNHRSRRTSIMDSLHFGKRSLASTSRVLKQKVSEMDGTSNGQSFTINRRDELSSQFGRAKNTKRSSIFREGHSNIFNGASRRLLAHVRKRQSSNFDESIFQAPPQQPPPKSFGSRSISGHMTCTSPLSYKDNNDTPTQRQSPMQANKSNPQTVTIYTTVINPKSKDHLNAFCKLLGVDSQVRWTSSVDC